MRASRVVVAIVLVILVALTPASLFAVSVARFSDSMHAAAPGREWQPADEGDHYPSGREWWNVDAFLTTESGTRWSLTASFEYEMETPACNLFLTLFNLDTGQRYRLGSYGDPIGTLAHAKGEVNLHYGASWMAGSYPVYDVHFERRGVRVTLHYEACTPPRYVADSISHGILPMGVGHYVYGFIPRCDVTGVLIINNSTHQVLGVGYYEHVWGNWTYGNPLRNPSDLEGILSAYVNLAGWWLSHRSMPPPSSIGLATESNMFGYDWIWAAFDNGWSMFYGNLPFWVYEGPAFGILYLVSEDGEYHVFSDISYTYGELRYVPAHDVYYPTSVHLQAQNGNQRLSLTCSMACDVHTYLDTNLSSPYWRAIYLWESPGPVEGTYSHGSTTVLLNGTCEIEPMRQVSALGHNRLRVGLGDSPGLELQAVSHFWRWGFDFCLRVYPRPAVRLRFMI